VSFSLRSRPDHNANH